MNTTSLIVWLGLSLVASAAAVLLLRSKTSKDLGTARRIAAAFLTVFIVFAVLVPVLLVPSIGILGALMIIGAIILIVGISAWKWWVLYLPWPF